MAELDERISGLELTEWMAYERIAGPLGPERSDIHAAQVSAAILNAMKGKKGKRAEIGDLVLQWDRHRREAQTPEQMLRAVRGINRTLGGTEGGAT